MIHIRAAHEVWRRYVGVDDLLAVCVSRALDGWAGEIDRFRAAVQEAKVGSDKVNPDIPQVSAPVIVKYVTDLQLIGLL